MGYQLGIDIGGTFTDLFLYDGETDEIHQEKVSTTPEDFSQGFIDAIEAAFGHHDIQPDEVDYVAHGTTVATNALIEREGAKTGLLTTSGFRDVTAIGREDRENVYELSPSKNPTFTDRRHRLGIDERVMATGTVREALDESVVRSAAEQLAADDVESVAIAFIHAYLNDIHEQRAREITQEIVGVDVPLSLSSEVMPEIREYERTLSTVINAYITPSVQSYIDSLETQLADKNIRNTLYLIQASGGVVTPENINGRIIQLINSGPAAGVIGAKSFAESSDIESIITLDMGGTSADACVVRNGEIERTTEGELNGIPLHFPQVDVRAVGAGGGSIAWLNPTDVLKVGPKSAGAVPGPACYGRGGTDPTVTDAALLLGYLDPQYFLGGKMTLDEGAAESAIEPYCETLGRDPIALADGILDIAATGMTQAIRLVTVEKGYDPRDFALTCYGGAGPLFATRLAKKLDIETVLIPTAPGVLSASGVLAADKKHDFSQTHIVPLDTISSTELDDIFEALAEDAANVIDEGSEIVRSVDLRYEGQTSKLNIGIPDKETTDETIAAVRESFNEQHETQYGHSNLEEAVEAVTWRLNVVQDTGNVATPVVPNEGSVEDALKETREAYTHGEFRPFTVYDRYKLPTNAEFAGPAIVEEAESTTIIGPAGDARIDTNRNLIVKLSWD